MKRLWIVLLSGLFLVVLFGALVLDDPGSALLIYGRTEVEMSLAVLVIAWLLMLLLALLAITLVTGVIRLVQPRLARRYWQQWASARRARMGFYALIGGRWKRAQVLLSSAAKGMQHSLPAWLGAALAAHENGNSAEAEKLLEQAQQQEGGGELAAYLLRSQIRAEQGLLEAARNELVNAHEKYAEHPRVVRQLVEVSLRLEDWHRLESLLPALREIERDPAVFSRTEKKVLLGRLREEAERPGFNNDAERVNALQELWGSFSRASRRDETVVIFYARYLSGLDATDEAETVLRDSLDFHWSDVLVAEWGRLAVVDASRSLKEMEKLLSQRATNVALLLAAGRMALRCRQWGKARDWLAAAAEQGGQAEAWAELARLQYALGEKQKAEASLQKQMKAASAPLPELPLPS